MESRDALSLPVQRQFEEPVIAADGMTYERSAIAAWFEQQGPVSAMTNERLSSTVLTENRAISAMIQAMQR